MERNSCLQSKKAQSGYNRRWTKLPLLAASGVCADPDLEIDKILAVGRSCRELSKCLPRKLRTFEGEKMVML